ncbi:transcriptional regulator [Clostridium carboxidivorans P7]|uniref:Transcriptional regulator, TrmB n=1 Tax=Clostridium carboxidivorans P7 TaxID=536227 RepID=C6PVN1_9CLOT|nr:helix-turn-helix domain-containing protein [Clostridium carboxidivorans]AKN30224.1 transcriptional regulator [Clostridium carboxidivorans P7]EET86728.1 transcriptional regulator, TrmB [Clostridium carboxidivorans P7]
MEKNSLFTKLQKFGLNQYEAKAYVALLSIGTANAYSISKASGIPRSRIYDILESITNRGIIMFEETSDNIKNYTALPSNVFLERIREEWSSTYNDVEKELKLIEDKDKKEDIYVSTVKGEKNILAFCKNLMHDAKNQIVISIWNHMYAELLPDLQLCIERGCKVSGMTFEVDNPINFLDKHRKSKLHNTIEKKPWFILSVDSKKLLYGHSSELNGNAFYTDDPTHIYLLEDYIFHDIVINRLIKKEDNEHQAVKMISEILNEMKVNLKR